MQNSRFVPWNRIELTRIKEQQGQKRIVFIISGKYRCLLKINLIQIWLDHSKNCKQTLIYIMKIELIYLVRIKNIVTFQFCKNHTTISATLYLFINFFMVVNIVQVFDALKWYIIIVFKEKSRFFFFCKFPTILWIINFSYFLETLNRVMQTMFISVTLIFQWQFH